MSNCSFTLRSTRLRDSSGNIVMDEQFYLNNDTYTEALKDILHCFAFGNSIWRKNMTIRKECGSYISFNFFLNGDAEIQYESRKLTAHAGDLLAAQFRNGFTVKTGPSGMARKQCLLLSYTPVQAAICRQLFPEDLTLVHLPHPGRIRKILDEIAGNVSGDTCEMDLLCQMLMFLQELRNQLYSRHKPEPLVQAIRFLTQQGNARIRRKELAEHCGISISSLNRLFRDHLGCSPGQYMIQQRLELAARLLMLHNGNIKQIAYEAGFSSPMFFSREFRQHYGMTPSAFRHKQFYPAGVISSRQPPQS